MPLAASITGAMAWKLSRARMSWSRLSSRLRLMPISSLKERMNGVFGATSNVRPRVATSLTLRLLSVITQ